jgi:transposase InsO family protein
LNRSTVEKVLRRYRKGTRPGYAFLHHAVDDNSRLAYSEILADEKKEAAAAFWTRARTFFADHGITVLRVLTDNGSCYHSFAFRDALGTAVSHKFATTPSTASAITTSVGTTSS